MPSGTASVSGLQPDARAPSAATSLIPAGYTNASGGLVGGGAGGSVTTGSVTTGSVTTGSVTTGSVTTGSVTTGSVTTGSVRTPYHRGIWFRVADCVIALRRHDVAEAVLHAVGRLPGFVAQRLLGVAAVVQEEERRNRERDNASEHLNDALDRETTASLLAYGWRRRDRNGRRHLLGDLGSRGWRWRRWWWRDRRLRVGRAGRPRRAGGRSGV